MSTVNSTKRPSKNSSTSLPKNRQPSASLPKNGQLDKLYPILNNTLPAIELNDLVIKKPTDEKLPVPTVSLREDLNFKSTNAIETVQDFLVIPKTAALPIVRDQGVLKTIDELAQILNFKNHKFSTIEFWYLDILTDFLWRMQDEFALPAEEQRIGLAWVIFFLKLLTNHDLNYNRDEVFEIMKEFVILAGESMNDGDPCLPEPEELGKIMTIEDCYAFNQKETVDDDDENEAFDYLDVRTKNNRGLYILRDISCSSGTEISASPDISISSLSYASAPIADFFGAGNSSNESTKMEENKKFDSEINELAQNANLEILSVKTMFAIIDYLFEYFHDEFQYNLIRTALLNPPDFKDSELHSLHYPKTLITHEPKVDKPASATTSKHKTKSKKKKVTEEVIEQDKSLPEIPYDLILKKNLEYSKYIYPLDKGITQEFWDSLFPPEEVKSKIKGKTKSKTGRTKK